MRCPSCHRRVVRHAACPGCGAPAAAAAAPVAAPDAAPAPPGLSPLGRGATATVWLDGAGRVHKRVAPEDAARATCEAAALARLGPPHTPRLVSCDAQPGGSVTIVMERAPGRCLADELAAAPGRGALPPARVLALGRALARAVAALHARGVVHRDLKPEHVFVADDDHAVIIDLGLARLDGALPPGDENARVGTPAYMAPEQVQDTRLAGPAADLYSVGVMLFEAATGRPPFVGSPDAIARAHVSERPPRPGALAPAPLPAALDALVLACLAKRPEDRPAGGEAILAALAAAEAETAAGPRAAVAAAAAGPAEAAAASPAALVAVRGVAPVRLQAAIGQAARLGRAGAAGCVLVVTDAGGVAAAVRRAVALAERLRALAPAGPAVIHVADVRARGRALAGEALDGTWSAGAPDEAAGPLLTVAAAAALEPGACRPAVAGFHALAAAAPAALAAPVPLVGRADVLDELVADVTRALDGDGPLLVLVEGEAGVGKTRLLDAVAARFAAAAVALARVDAGATGDDAGAIAAFAAAVTTPHAALVLVDRGERAGPELVDAIERATRAEARRQAVVVAAGPALAARRPELLAHATRGRRVEVAPLLPEDARRLAAALLAPAEFVPAALLDALARRSAGVPQVLVELAASVRQSGALRAVDGEGAAFVAGDELLRLGAPPVAETLARRVLGTLPAPLVRLATLVACWGERVDVGELEALQDAVDPAHAGAELAVAARLDPAVALGRLADAGLLVPLAPDATAGFAFRSPVLREGTWALAAPDERAQAHRAALAVARDRGRLADVARHAAGAGETHLAVETHAALAEADARAQRWPEAEAAFSAALAAGGEALAPATRRRLLAGRGAARIRLQRVADALVDLRAARALAQELGDRAAELAAWLDEATALDWQDDWPGSAAATEAARALGATGPAFELALGRAAFRREDLGTAIEHLERAEAGAAAAGDDATAIVAGLLLAPALLYRSADPDGLAASEAGFDRLLGRCERADDRFHLAVALFNRVVLWLRHERLDRAEADLAQAGALARELGLPQIERWARHNLGEVLLWAGAPERALPHARRARELAARWVAGSPTPENALLCARILVALGRLDEAAAELAWVQRTCEPSTITPLSAALARIVELSVGRVADPGPWAAAVAEVRARSQLFEAREAVQAAERACGRPVHDSP